MPRQPEWESYVVKYGDTLSDISRTYGVDVADVARVNRISDPNLIQTGAELRVRKHYVVTAGDTLGEIAQSFAVRMIDLLAFNEAVGSRIANADMVFPGQRIYLPGPYVAEEGTKTPAADSGAPAKPAPEPPKNPKDALPKLKGEAVAYDDDIVPAHRRVPSPSLLQIGDVQFVVPPSFIHVSSTSNVETTPGLRQKGTIKTKSGYTQTEIRIDLWFVGIDQINGIPVPSPMDDGLYYMDGLRALVAQFKKCPILPVQNRYLNETHGIESVVLMNLVITTVEGFPNTLKATLVLHQTTVEPYLGRDDGDFPHMICWPVFRWYYQQMVTDSLSRSGMTYLEPVRTRSMTGAFKFYVMDEKWLADNTSSPDDITVDPEDRMVEVPFTEGAVINNVVVSMANRTAKLQTQMKTVPTHQYLGGSDTLFILNLTCDDASLQNLVELKAMTEEYSVKYRDRFVSGFIRLENELVQLMGVRHVLISALESEIVEGMPGWNNVTLQMISYDRDQRRNESLNQINYAEGTWDDVETVFEGDLNHINHAIVVERMLNGMELYPDLELPTFAEAKAGLKKINAQRERHGLKPLKFEIEPPKAEFYQQSQGTMFVDPDFFMAYAGLMPGGLYAMPELVDALGKVSGAGGEIDMATGDRAEDGAVSAARRAEMLKSGMTAQFSYRPLVEIPQGHWLYNIVDKAAKRKGIDPNLVACLIWKENGKRSWSAMTPDVQSWKGAMGVMQVMPDTARGMGYDPDQLFDPAVNVEAGTHFFADRLKRWKGVLPLALAGYNAGDGAVEEWLDWTKQNKKWAVVKAAIDANTIGAARTSRDSWLVQTVPYVEDIIDKYVSVGGPSAPAGSTVDFDPSFLWDAGIDSVAMKTLVPLEYEPGPDGVPSGEDLIRGCYHDMARYNRRGQFIRAFPTYCLLFIDEGQWMDGRRTWTRYFAYHSLSSITVAKERTNPADTCHIILTNVYGTLDRSQILDKKILADALPFWEKGGTWKGTWNTMIQELAPELNQDIVDYRKKAVEHASIRPGARIHLRMGYGATCMDLPVVFNGTVAEMNAEDAIELVAQGDGIELTNVFTQFQPDDHNTMWTFGNEPQNIVAGILAERDWIGRLYGDFGEASPFGIEHFGVLKKYRGMASANGDVPSATMWSGRGYDPNGKDKGKRVRLKEWNDNDRVDWSFPFWIYNEMDLIKNVYSSNYSVYLDQPNDQWFSTKNASGWNSSLFKWYDGEKNIQLYLGNRTPWDIFTTVAKTLPDYIVAVHPHQFRSTLFFGLPHLPVRYGYTLRPDAKDKPKDSYERYHDRMKPFVQFHVYSSYTDIIHNGVKSTTKYLVHNCAAQYSLGGALKVAPVVHADDTIKSDQIRTEVIDTGILNDLMLPIPDAWLKFFGVNNGGEERAMAVARAHVRETFKDMYQGNLIVLGDPAVKPHDLFNLSDFYTNMNGVALVGGVVHEMSVETGFITSIKPDLVTELAESPLGDFYRAAQRALIPMGMAILKGREIFRALRTLRGYGWIRAGKDALQIADVAWMGAKDGFKAIKTTRSIVKGLQEIRAAGTLIGTASAAPTLGASLVALAAWEALWVALDKLLMAGVRYLENRNVIHAYPLWYKGKPYMAGVDGYRKLVPNLMDPWYYPQQSVDANGETVSIDFDNPESTKFSESGPATPKASARMKFRAPVDPARTVISDRFGTWDEERKGLGLGPHQGVDYKPNDGKEGHRILASADGVVESAIHYSTGNRECDTLGNFIYLRHADGVMTLYAHLKDFQDGIIEGKTVRQGEVIGYMGGAPGKPYSGKSTGTHLHFGLLVNGEARDPLGYVGKTKVNEATPA